MSKQIIDVRTQAVTVVVATTALLLGLVAHAGAQVPPGEADYSAYATGTVIHAEALETADPELQDPTSTRVVDAEVSFSGALVDSTGLTEDRFNEWGGLVMPAQDGKNAYGRGYGMDAAFGEEGGTDDPQVRLAGLAEAAAPPEDGPNVEEIAPADADPLAYATLLRGEAYAQPADSCVLGSDLSYGTGFAEEAELLDQSGSDPEGEEQQGLEDPVLATNAADPERTVSWSTSRDFLGPQTNADGERIGSDVAVIAESRQTIAPVTLQLGADDPTTDEDEANTLTIEFLGEWVLRAHAGGVPGSAYVHYGPGEVSPSAPILRVIQDDGTTDELTTQDLLGDEGQTISIGDDATTLAEVTVGEDPRAIGGDADSQPQVAADGTSASAAVDVVRVKLLSETEIGEVTEIRIGHMEVSATVPEGGLDCDLPVDKSVDKALVQPGDDFTYTIRITNPYGCTLRNVRVVDELTADDGVTWTVTGSDPQADSLSDTQIVWNDVGPIAPGDSVDLTVAVSVDDDSQAGLFREIARATAECFDQPVEGEDEAGVGIPIDGEGSLDLPEVGVPAAAAPPALPSTGGGALATLGALAMLGSAGLIWRRRT